MTGTTADIWAIVSVAMVSLTAMITLIVWYAPTHPAHKRRSREPLRGLVVGSQHVGGGRSVAPYQDAPVPEGARAPSGDEPDVAYREKQEAAPGRTSSGSPLDQ